MRSQGTSRSSSVAAAGATTRCGATRRGATRGCWGRRGVKPHGTTARGGKRWRAADGPKPGEEYLTPADAEAALRRILIEAEQITTPVKRRDVTFLEACEEWLRYTAHDRQRRPSTVRDYRNMLRAELLPAFGSDTLVSQITTDAIDAYREYHLQAGRISRRTLQKNLIVLHGVLKRAHRKGWVAANAAATAERVSTRRSGEFNVLSPEQVQAASRAACDDTIGALILVAGFTGLRMGELLALRWRDVAFLHRSLFVRASWVKGGGEGPPKSGKIRSVPLVDQAMGALDHLSRRPVATRDEDLVFCTAAGDRLRDSVVRHAFYGALAGAGLGHLRDRDRPIVFHNMRHTFGTLAVQVFPLSDVQAYMGHQDISTTMIYVHHVPRHDAADRLSQPLHRGGAPVVYEGPAQLAN